MSAIKQFSTTESFNYQSLLDEAIESIASAHKELGPFESLPDAKLEDELSPLRKLKDAQAFFAPRLTVQRLRKKAFAERSLTPSSEVKKWFDTHHFYLMQVPVTLRPSSGWLFNRLECWVGFDDSTVKVHDICPANAWVDVLQASTSLTLGLDENLSFSANLALAATDAAYTALSATAQSPAAAEKVNESDTGGSVNVGVGLTAAGGMKLVVGPFNYQIWRPQVLTVGRENAETFWHLDGGERVQRQEPYLAVVLRVPKQVKVLSASGALIAYHDYNRLAADRRDWWYKLRDKVKAFILGGLPLENEMQWENVLETED